MAALVQLYLQVLMQVLQNSKLLLIGFLWWLLLSWLKSHRLPLSSFPA
jgi:hypothetical protein